MQASIDETIQRIDRLYESLTGQTAPVARYGYAPIPPEADATKHVEEQLSRLLAMVQGETAPVRAAPVEPEWRPACSIRNDASNLLIELDLPGVRKQDIDVSVVRDTVTVSGRRPLPTMEAPAPTSTRFRMSERPFGPFQRTIVLPDGAEPDKLEAAIVHGVLALRVPLTRSTETETAKQPIPIHIPVK
jgi:HSP20 family protein